MSRLTVLFLCAVFVGSSALYGQQAAIRANGIIESGQTGFRFPDGTIQATAATVTGGVPSVNGIPGAVTVAGSGGNTVSTASGTITVAGPYKRTIIVSPVPNDPTASGTALLNALASITTNSATNRYLLKIEPGTYDIGANQLVMKSYVDIEGSGQSVTRIEAERGGEGEVPGDVAAVLGASVTELRALTVVNVSSQFASYAYAAANVSDVRLTDLTLHASAAAYPITVMLYWSQVIASELTIVTKGQQVGGMGMAMVGASSSLVLRDSSLLVDGGGTATEGRGFVFNEGAIGTVDSSTIEVRGALNSSEGVSVHGGSLTITNSTVRVTGSTARKGAQTTGGSTSKLDIHDSRIIVGNVWNNPSIVALYESPTTTIRAYSTLTDSASYGAPVCVLTYSYSGTTSCPPPS